MLLLLLYFYEDEKTSRGTDQWVLFGICMFTSIFTLARILNYYDVYGLTGEARKSYIYHTLLGVWRLCEIILRVSLWALFATYVSAKGLF